ncbi:bifunctional hydroxymethylpyrimidine kinase/phosphomethylpyrimidine kinase [Rhodocaloribacter litoris]|uniref:bifunctional hydroxymethylpyrimidine kinase/phosphomethylpyrimidine kinase n=1 Tax=Rhodocaloribacter litoris TaxID=2558931 RepID=UPI00141DC058|nr:bifunctional hydroxymethylpyrimidine kinase/phosphomethylpyrimidine kinase [Rhodocaloribacter litoris]QXD16291.1 bifunctional hydroxymethylpyrimidine kinase/phosphomethylpyrimidine kinase [Rhodocaloribacter litoris]
MSSASPRRYTRALTIATSDSGGGAGIQADLKTFGALGCYGMSVIVALTAQNTHEVRAIHAAPPGFVTAQIDAVVEDLGVDAVKIGMLFNAEIMRAVADRLQAHGLDRVVLDPVMVAKSGARLIEEEAVETLKTHLLPLSLVVTPNLPEAEVLLGRSINGRADMEAAARELLGLGPRAVLLKGGHLAEAGSADCLVLAAPDPTGRDVFWFESERVDTPNTHGTGCTLSSAIAAGLAREQTLPEAVRNAKAYVTGALKAGRAYRIGQGHGPLHHFFSFWT